jgi:hypothetical protein
MVTFRLKVFLRSLFGERIWSVVQRLSPLPRHRLIRLSQRETNRVVRAGPFAGMKYIHQTIASGDVPKLLGIYERELHGIISSLSARGIRHIINIGAADGYYAVGLSRMFPELRVIAFEMEPRGREFVRAMAERNGVLPQIEIRGRCELEDLSSVINAPQPTLILCDVEGYEEVLMDPEKVPGLRHAYLLVEIHDNKNAGVSEKIRCRFGSTHQLNTIWQEKREPAEFPFATPYTRSLDPEHLTAAVDEGRPVRPGAMRMSWLWMVPNSSPA